MKPLTDGRFRTISQMSFRRASSGVSFHSRLPCSSASNFPRAFRASFACIASRTKVTCATLLEHRLTQRSCIRKNAHLLQLDLFVERLLRLLHRPGGGRWVAVPGAVHAGGRGKVPAPRRDRPSRCRGPPVRHGRKERTGDESREDELPLNKHGRLLWHRAHRRAVPKDAGLLQCRPAAREGRDVPDPAVKAPINTLFATYCSSWQMALDRNRLPALRYTGTGIVVPKMEEHRRLKRNLFGLWIMTQSLQQTPHPLSNSTGKQPITLHGAGLSAANSTGHPGQKRRQAS